MQSLELGALLVASVQETDRDRQTQRDASGENPGETRGQGLGFGFRVTYVALAETSLRTLTTHANGGGTSGGAPQLGGGRQGSCTPQSQLKHTNTRVGDERTSDTGALAAPRKRGRLPASPLNLRELELPTRQLAMIMLLLLLHGHTMCPGKLPISPDTNMPSARRGAP